MPAQTLYVTSLPASATNERLEEIFSEVGPVKQCFVVREKGTEKCRGFGFVTYSMEEDAQRALKEIKDYDGKKLFLSVAKKKIKDKNKADKDKESSDAPVQAEQKTKDIRQKISKKSRLIIRNLSFKCTEDDLKEAFGKFGTVVEANIPLKPDGKKRGFAFVQFKDLFGATKAFEAMNLKEIKGRQVAVDWAVPKDKYTTAQQSTSSDNKVSEEKSADKGSDTDDDCEPMKETPPEKKKVGLKAAEHRADEAQSSDEDDSEEQDSEEEDENESHHEEDDDDNDDEVDDDDSFDSNDDHEESEDEETQPAQKKPKKLLPSDVNEGRTVFIRNLSFDTDEEGLEEVLLRYGELNYVKIVLNPDTDFSKGCAFAQFKTKEAADKCIVAAQDEAESCGIHVDGRKLFIVAAVSRDDATQLKDSKKKVETGSRNLYLAREGLIRAGTKAAEGVSELDMTKRARFESVKRAKLRDISVFVSKTRLCVHNLPKSVDNKKLKALCLQALKGVKRLQITECRVMYDRKPEKGQAVGQSLGYGFVQFRDHEQALSTLRYLNNNPDIFGPQKRPIVEFSLEDSRKLKVKELRQQKQKDFIRNQSFKGKAKQSQISAGCKGPTKGGNEAQSSSEQTGEKRTKQFLGFQTKSEVEHVDLQNGKKRKKVLPFPSHRGPKIRKRDKGKKQVQPVKTAKPGSKRNKYQRQQIEKPTQPRNQKAKASKKQVRKRDGDRFESLVEQYKKKLIGNSDKNATIKRSKWFDG
ncbi:RNA-binding protein 28 isoform X2 [Kryptolebias marmoratus]|uniref:RNA-binding protein 28 isoform X2 n=1 Tax=Kryptolebias marmoratus TaxID=37003 RepID=UPI0007F8C696|nr:RNA-binding protein 28 isoform X2 [Kryptolebias marmoratus]